MKHFTTLLLAFIFTFTSLSPAFAQQKKSSSSSTKQSSCENGECIEGLIKKLKNLNSLYTKQCLPKGIKESQIKAYHEEHGFTEECWKIVTEIKHLDNELMDHQARLEAKVGCEGGKCKTDKSAVDSLTEQIAKVNKTQEENTCSPTEKKQVSANCSSDMNCALMATATGASGYLAELLVPKDWKPKNCNLGDDNCTTQLVTGFIKAAFTFFESLWDLTKLIGKAAKDKLKQFWNWATEAENHSSTSQLAMAKASEDPGVFDMLLKDFPGTMKKIWQALVASIKEWLKTDIFCQKWSGVPHLSQCLKPTDSFDCISCKTMINGVCALGGALVAEVVPSFFTGGLTTAAKYGAQGASKIAKLFKVSAKTSNALKATKLGKVAVSTASKADDALKISRAISITRDALIVGINAIKAYSISPTRAAVSGSMRALSSLTKTTTAWVAETASGKVLVYSAKGLQKLGKVVFYPIENPMTAAAFKAGQRSFDKVFKLGAAKVSGLSGTTARVVSEVPEIESKVAKLESLKLSQGNKVDEIQKLEQEIYEHIVPKRATLADSLLKDEKLSFNEIVKELYPELDYGNIAKTLGEEKLIQVEKELLEKIGKLPNGPRKEELLNQYQLRLTQGEARGQIVSKSTDYATVLRNSKLNDDARVNEALKLIGKNSISEKQKTALISAHKIGTDNGVYEYTWLELRHKHQILIDGGFTPNEASELIRAGLAGRPPVRELIEPGENLFSGFADDILDRKYLDKRKELEASLLELSPEKQPGFFGKLFGKKATQTNDAFDNFESLYFIDHQHSIDELMDVTKGVKNIENAKLTERYEKLAFDNFKETRKWLLDEEPPVNKDTLLKIHERMLKGGVEGATPDHFGLVRDGYWRGGIPPMHGISDEVLKHFDENPYLIFEGYKAGNGLNAGQVWYPNVDYVKKEALDLIKDRDPKLVQEILDMQKQIKDGHNISQKVKEQVTRRLVDSLTDDVMDWFTRERTLIGEINTPEKLDQFTNVLAKFQRDLVSIHPVANGNGRSTRELMNYILMKEGFPPARIIDTNADIYRSLDEWKGIIKKGILASDQLMDDLLERRKFGLPLENSYEMITPYQKTTQTMVLKGQTKKVTVMEGVEHIDPRLYREIVKRIEKTDPAFTAKIQQSPIEAWEKINEEASKVFQKNNIYYNHPKKGIERVELGFVDDDFKHLYGKASFDNQELFDFKMKSWYSEDINWRGLASRSGTKSEDEILNMFKELNSHMASNSVLKQIGGKKDPETIRNAALADFQKYNDDVFGDGLVQMAKDHSETGPMYGISYGYSTSKNREVGKAFAMGAMVVGEYGQHKAPELQALLSERILVGARKSMKDVDLGRLKQVRPEFSYKYGRQQEVMGVGASDPDAISIIQTIDAKGDVIQTYLRNPKKANEIWLVKGDIDPYDTPTAAQLIKTITLK